MFAEVTRPDTETPTRIIVPTRPSLLGKDEKVRIMIVAPGKDAVRAVTLHIRLRGMAGWNAIPANLMGRRTYQALIGPFDPKAQLAEYYVSATAGRKEVVAPADAPQNSYLLTLA